MPRLSAAEGFGGVEMQVRLEESLLENQRNDRGSVIDGGSSVGCAYSNSSSDMPILSEIGFCVR